MQMDGCDSYLLDSSRVKDILNTEIQIVLRLSRVDIAEWSNLLDAARNAF